MAYATIGSIQRRAYTASNHSSTTAAVWVVPTRSQLLTVFQAVKVSLGSTSHIASWTVSVNGTQATGLSSVAVGPATAALGAAGVQQTSASVTAITNLARGDVVSVVGSTLPASAWTFVVREY